MLFPTNANQVQAFAGALYGVQVGSVTIAQVNSDIAAAGGLSTILNRYYSASFGSMTTTAVATTFATNLGLTGAALEEGVAYTVARLNAVTADARGAEISAILNLFSTLTADATFGVAATAWTTKVTAAAAYTGTANVAIGTVVADSGGVFTLTTGVDSGSAFTGGVGNDTFTATNSTLTLGDVLNGGSGTDTLNLASAAALSSLPAGASVTSIETVNALSATDANVFNTTSGFSGLTTLNVTGIENQTVTAAATTDINVTETALATGDTVTVNGGKNVTVTSTSPAAIATTAIGGTITIGAATAAAGNVVVNSASSVAATVNLQDHTAGQINVTGGTSIDVTSTITATAAAAAVVLTGSDTVSMIGSDINLNGDANTTTVTVTQSPTVTAVSDAAIGRIGNTGGAVDVLDVNSASLTAAGTIQAVTITNAGAVTVNSGALTTLNLAGTLTTVNAGTSGALTTAANSSIALNLTGAVSTGAVTLDRDFTTVNVSGNTTASTIADLVSATITTINVTGDAKVTFTDYDPATITSINVTNTGGAVFATSTLATGTTFTGGAGDDTILLTAGFTKANTMGAGNDTVTYAAQGTGGSVAAGDGTDTIIMTTAQTNSTNGVSSSAVFNTKFTGFETLRVSDAHTTVVDLDGVNGATKVILAAGSNAGTINNLASGGTVQMNTTSNVTGLTIGVKSALVGGTDVVNLVISNTGDVYAAGAIAVANVETINIAAADSVTAGSDATTNTMTLQATSATSVTVTGNNGLTLVNTGNIAIINFDASGVVANNTVATTSAIATTDTAAALAVTFASANLTASANVTIKGGAGNDVLTGTIAKDTISGGAGADTIYSDNAGNKTTFATANIDVSGSPTGATTVAVSFMGITTAATSVTLAGANPTNTEIQTAVKAAVAADAILSKLLTVTSVGAADLVFASKVDGTTATLPTVTITPAGGAATYTAGNATAGAVGTVAVDTIDGGAGADFIVGGGGADVITTGAGADTVFFLKGQSNAATLATITDYTFAVGGASNDKIILGDVTTVIGTTTTVQDLSAQTSLANALNAAALTNGTDAGLSVFLFGGDTYAFVETTGATGTYVATDFVVKLTGLPLAAGATIAGSGFDAV